MRPKKTVLKICLPLFIFLICANNLFAQKITKPPKKETRSIFQAFKNNHYGVLPSLGKMKAAADNGVVQLVSQSLIEGKWMDSYRVNYEYSSDRSLITMYTEGFVIEDSEWENQGFITLQFNSDGLIESSMIDMDFGTIDRKFYYSSTNPVKIDSITYHGFYGDLESFQTDVFNYVTQDSILSNHIVTVDGITETYYQYLLNKDGNFIEVYDEDDYLDRYINIGISFTDYIKNLGNDFFFVETHNDRLYSDETEFTPYSRITLSKNGEVVTGTLEEFYDDTEHRWLAETRHTFTYEKGKLVMDEEGYSEDGTNWISEYRTLYSYSGPVVSNESENEVVRDFNLSQNYPNPFNPSTKIVYSIPKAEHVTLQVFNVIGNRVATLVEAPQQAGSHTVIFDARNYPSGIYYYKLITGNSVEVRSMTLIK